MRNGVPTARGTRFRFPFSVTALIAALRAPAAVLLFSTHIAVLTANTSASGGWPMYGGDPAGTKYSALDQINRANVRELTPAWTYRCDDMTLQPASTIECNPIVIEGKVAYIVWWVHGRLVAIDLSNPESPAILGELETPPLHGGWAYRVVVAGKTAFLSADQFGTKVGGVHAVDVSDPTNLKPLGFFSAEGYASHEPEPRKWTRNMALDGNNLFVTDYATGLVCLDVSNPAAM